MDDKFGPKVIAQFVPYLHRLQKSISQGMVCSLMGHHAEEQYQCKASRHRAHNDNVISAVQINGSAGEWLRTTVGVWQGCLL